MIDHDERSLDPPIRTLHLPGSVDDITLLARCEREKQAVAFLVFIEHGLQLLRKRQAKFTGILFELNSHLAAFFQLECIPDLLVEQNEIHTLAGGHDRTLKFKTVIQRTHNSLVSLLEE